MPMKRRLEELNVIDNFMFNELMMQENQEKAKEFCKAILEPIIDKKIEVINIETESQRIIQGSDTNKRGIQLDAYVKVYENENGDELVDVSVSLPTIYDIEPNNEKNDSDRKRTRMYHSLIDSHIIESGTDYNEIPDVIVIWLLPYDPFGYDRMVYTVSRQCMEVPEMKYSDGDKTLFLYAYGKKNIPSKKLADMLKFIVDSTKDNAINSDMKNIYEMMQQIRANRRIGVKFMQSWEEKGYYYGKGKAEGRVEGLAEITLEMLSEKGQLSEELRELIMNEKDENKLKKWVKQTISSDSIQDFVDNM